jgi:hypothetical protein
MAGTISKQLLSGSTSGRGIKVVATATAGTTIHTAHASDYDEIYAWGTNNHTATVELRLEWGGVTDPDDQMIFNIPAGETWQIAAGQILTGGLVLAAFADQANLVAIHGFVNRIDK